MKVLCDLDGVIYRGGSVLAGVPAALGRLESAGVDVFYITNNSTRTPAEVAEKIGRLTAREIDPNTVLPSSLAAVSLLGPEDGPVLVVGERGVRDAVARAGLEETHDPSAARSVLVGLARQIDYELLHAAMTAVRNGARYIATNDDTTLPTEDGLAPGAGSIVAAISAASGQRPVVAGKPYWPMRDLIRSRGVGEAWVVGDRLDTDIAFATSEDDWTSVLVMTGVTTEVSAEGPQPDHVVADLPAAVDLVLSAPGPS